MNKANWFKHMEEEGIIRPSLGGDKLTWSETIKSHLQIKCPSCLARKKTRENNQNARERNEMLTMLCGTSASAARKDMGL